MTGDSGTYTQRTLDITSYIKIHRNLHKEVLNPHKQTQHHPKVTEQDLCSRESVLKPKQTSKTEALDYLIENGLYG